MRGIFLPDDVSNNPRKKQYPICFIFITKEVIQLQYNGCPSFCWTIFKFLNYICYVHENRFMSFTHGPKLNFDFNNNIHEISSNSFRGEIKI